MYAIRSYYVQQFEDAKETISGIRNIRTKNNIPNKDTLELAVMPGDKGYYAGLNAVVSKLGNLSAYNEVSQEVSGAGSFLVKSSTYFVPLGELVDIEAELKKLEEELKYTQGFLKSVMGKLSNERFVAGAPEAVVAKERAKQADAEAKIKVLEEQIAKLK